MGWSDGWGHFLFIAVPLALWFIGILAARRFGDATTFLAFIVGSDKRLSLSRAQAFAWTLTIFGAFAAAMAVSTKVTPGTWVGIPTELLALAGIAIGSGVFSSLIATQSGEDQTATVASAEIRDAPAGGYQLVVVGKDLGTGVRARLGTRSLSMRPASKELADRYPGYECIVGDLPCVKKGEQTLLVDTQNGRVCYRVTIQAQVAQNLALLQETACYELADFFRDDRNPQGLDLMKFQMFGWTVVALAIYIYLFWTQLNPSIARLPTVDPTIVILTGLSQAGYLSAKAVSTITPADK